eukprot:jgi/Antlo1/2511/1707
MILSEAVNKVKDMVLHLEQLPKLKELQTQEYARVPELVVKKKREKLFTHIRPYLTKIASDIAEYQSSFTEEMLADARARYEAVRSEVNKIEDMIREHGLAEKIMFVKDLCKKKDFLLNKQRMGDIGPVSDTQQLKAALCTVKDVDTCQFSSEFCSLLSNEVLSGLTLPSQRELDSLSKICECLRE